MLFGACLVLSAGIAGSLIDPIAAALSRWVGEPVVSFTWTDLAAVCAATVIALRLVDDAAWSAVGLGAGAWRARTLLVGAGLGLLLIGIVTLALMAMGFLHFEPVAALLDGGKPAASAGGDWARFGVRMLVLLAPAALAEELVFRGYLWTVLQDTWGVRAALWGSSILFGAAHLQNPGAGVQTTLLVVLAGVALGTLRQRTGSLPAGWTAHLAWNWAMAAAVHVPVSGIPMATPGYRAVVDGPAWLTGGGWGPEGGLVAAITMSGALLMAGRTQKATRTTTRTGMGTG